MKKFVLALILVVGPVQAENGGQLQIQSVLSVGKFSGACGIFSQMENFQKETQMPGGDEFVSGFLAAEAARLDMKREEMLENCLHSNAAYKTLFEMAEVIDTQ